MIRIIKKNKTSPHGRFIYIYCPNVMVSVKKINIIKL